MRATYIFILIAFILALSGCSGKKNQNSLLIIVSSKYDAQHSIEVFTDALSKADGNYTADGTNSFEKIAKGVNIYLRPTMSASIDNPLVFSAILTCSPSMAMEFPLRISVYEELGGDVEVAYTNPEYWSLKHNIKDKNCLGIINKMARDFDEARGAITK